MLLVSCCGEDGSLFAVNEKTTHIKKVFPSSCTGIVQSPNGDIFVYSHPLRSICVFERNFVMKRHKEVGHNFHCLFLFENNLYAMDTYNDKLIAYDTFTLEEKFHWDFGVNHSGERFNDLYHINDVFIVGNTMLISMFRDKYDSNIEFYGDSGKVYVKCLHDLSTSFGGIFTQGLTQPHSPFLYGDEFYVCNSKESSIVVGKFRHGIVPTLDKREEIQIGDGFTRGLLVTAEKIYVGISNSVRRTTEEFKDVQCGITIIKRSTMKKQFIPLPASEVYGILKYE